MVRREFLELEADPRSPERGQYGFVQSLIREVAYGTLARRDRRARHLAAARYFEMLADEELAGVLASHYLAAHDASEPGQEADALAVQARIALRGAAERAAALGGHEQALVYLEQALAVSSDPAERVTLLEFAAESANATGSDAKAQDYARQALEHYAAVGDAPAHMRTVALMGRILLDNGHLSEAVAFMEQELSTVAEGSDSPESAEVLANLSRAFMRTDQDQRAIDTADRALKVAEPLNLERIVTEAFINKASSMHRLGRLRESLALHVSAVELADRNGYVDQQLRGRNNLSVAQVESEPERGLETVYEGIELARRLGQRSMFNWLVGTCAMYSGAIGRAWDRALGLVEETLTSSPNQYDRARALLTRSLLLARRGEDLDQLVAICAEASEGIHDGQITGGLDYVRAEVAFVQGRLADTHSASVHALDEWKDSAAFVLQTALHAAAISRRLADAQELKRILDGSPSGTPTTIGARTWATAVVDALEGRTQEALRGLRTAYETFSTIGLRYDAATLVLDALRLFPDEAEVAGWAPTARALFEGVGAAPYLRMLDEALAVEPTTRPAARDTSAKTATTA
jgi:tetratricopeptide (TPR) repeat protein